MPSVVPPVAEGATAACPLPPG